jgi:probable rRNA maturation factor
MIRTAVADNQRVVELDPRTLRRIVRTVLAGEGVADAEVSLAFVEDKTIHRLNKRFLNHDEPTDVITFPLSAPGDDTLSGEVVISTETADRVARALGHPVHAEVALYLIHGLLHLCGYDDLNAADRQRMRRREGHYLKRLGISLRAAVDDRGG